MAMVRNFEVMFGRN